jgi:hypothetical protein
MRALRLIFATALVFLALLLVAAQFMPAEEDGEPMHPLQCQRHPAAEGSQIARRLAGAKVVTVGNRSSESSGQPREIRRFCRHEAKASVGACSARY